MALGTAISLCFLRSDVVELTVSITKPETGMSCILRGVGCLFGKRDPESFSSKFLGEVDKMVEKSGKDALGGVLAPTVTPFINQSLEIDLQWTREHLRLLNEKGLDGVVPSGTNGEGPSMSLDERRRLIDVCLENKGDMQVVPGTGCASLTDTIELTKYALTSGADSVLVLPPFYFKNPPLKGLLAYFRTLCDKAVPPGKGIILYNIPQISAVAITHELLDGLLESHPECIWGVKDSTGDPDSLRAFVSSYPNLRIFAGSDRLAKLAYELGAAGTISALANIVPEWLKDLREKVASGDDEAAEGLEKRINRLRELLSIYPMRSTTKYIIHLTMGLPMRQVRPPEIELTEEEKSKIESEVREMVEV